MQTVSRWVGTSRGREIRKGEKESSAGGRIGIRDVGACEEGRGCLTKEHRREQRSLLYEERVLT